MPKVLVSYHPPFIPILKRIVAAVPNTKLIALHPDFARQLKDLDLPATILGEGVDRNVQYAGHGHAARIIREINTNVDKSALFPGVVEFLESGLYGALYPRLGELATLAMVVDSTNPDLIMVHNDVEPSARIVALWADAHHVPCLHVPHAVYIDNPDRGPIGNDVHDIVTASHIAVAGPYQQQWYDLRGGNTYVTGLPQYDKWANMGVDQKQARKLLGMNPNKPLVVYASTWRQDTNLLGCHDGGDECYANFLQACKAFPSVQFVVKTHPRGNNVDEHVSAAIKAKVDCTVTALHLETVLQAADVVIAYGPSNLLIEAAHLPHLRLLSVNGFQDDPEIGTIDGSVEQYEESIGVGLAVPPLDTRRFVHKYAGIPDGKGADRVATLAIELLKESSAKSSGSNGVTGVQHDE